MSDGKRPAPIPVMHDRLPFGYGKLSPLKTLLEYYPLTSLQHKLATLAVHLSVSFENR